MKKQTHMAYAFIARCINCKSGKKVYYTIADFGDSPIILKCNNCGELYWYTPDDEEYIQSLDKQLNGKTCETCKADLLSTLIPTHKNIQCSCGEEFSLDDDFAGHYIQPVTELEQIDVYLIYSSDV